MSLQHISTQRNAMPTSMPIPLFDVVASNSNTCLTDAQQCDGLDKKAWINRPAPQARFPRQKVEYGGSGGRAGRRKGHRRSISYDASSSCVAQDRSRQSQPSGHIYKGVTFKSKSKNTRPRNRSLRHNHSSSGRNKQKPRGHRRSQSDVTATSSRGQRHSVYSLTDSRRREPQTVPIHQQQIGHGTYVHTQKQLRCHVSYNNHLALSNACMWYSNSTWWWWWCMVHA